MSVLKIALALLNEYELQGKYVNLSLQSHRADALADSERALLSHLLYTTVEKKITYDYYIGYLTKRQISDIDMSLKNILRLGLCMICDCEGTPHYAAVNECVALAEGKHIKGFVNAVLRRAARECDTLPLPERKKNAARYLSVRYSYPLPLIRELIGIFGEEEAEQILIAYEKSRRITLTVNTKKITREEYIRMLVKADITATPSEYSPISVRLDRSYNPERLPGFSEGLFFVQDEASALCALALGATATDTVVDVCAAPGGKSFAAALSGARVYSFDVSESKLPLIISGKDRLGLGDLWAEAVDALVGKAELFGTCDRVICDVPCSGLGVLGKKPDMKYNAAGRGEELPELQYAILKASVRYLKPHGTLVYSTCTLNPRENREVVEKFIGENEGYSLIDFTLGELKSQGGQLTLLPHVHNTDGFFMAKIRKDK
ncbi:MAG: 16S rRNA (cytosine(967)-C(5))-methyltransferase RsmB [Clostridia bacterium]|nr:16S rRNA (cytosine(967)-C(5))-methyltransferase RsmB [Clostridia bacterium]